jgi:hypothetical protein
VGSNAAILVGLHQIASELLQQLFNFHGINRLTFCQSGCKADIVVAIHQIPSQLQQQFFFIFMA